MNEKAGGVPRPQSQMDSFRQIVNLCGFKDLGYCGPDYTWCNMQEGCNRILLRLDRALATSEWLKYFKDMRVHHLVDSTSDHCILLTTSSPFPVCNRKRRFHFEAMWVKRDDCREVIQEAWNSGTFAATPEGVASNLQKCEAALTNWNQNVVGNIQKKIHEKKRALNSLTMEDCGTGGAEINQLRREINDLLDSEETIWRQRSKVHWYREGDRNTKFFHARASERRKKNSILGIWNDDGIWCESKESVVAVAVSYFEKIYSTSSPSGISEVVDALPRCVSEDMNAELTKVFTRDEVIKALQQLHPTKAPGPDDPQKGERILDMCAAPGGKTTAIAMLMKDEGEVVAVDRSHNKVLDIQKLAAEMGLNCITAFKLDALKAVWQRNDSNITTNLCCSEEIHGVTIQSSDLLGSHVERNSSIIMEGMSTEKSGKESVSNEKANVRTYVSKADIRKNLRRIRNGSGRNQCNGGRVQNSKGFSPNSFDRVLLDAPCSALGLRPRLFAGEDTIESLRNHAKYQRRMFDQAVQLARPGGIIVYSTCTINPGENEALVRYALDRYTFLSLVPQHPRIGGPGLLGHCEFPDGYIEEWLRPGEEELVQRFDPSSPLDTIGFFIAKFIVGPKDA